MKKILLAFGTFAVVTTLFAFQPVVVSAQGTTPASGDRVQDGLNSIRDTYPENVRGTNETSLTDFAKQIIDWALYIAAVISVIFIIVGGYYYITSAGSDEQAKKGRKTLVNALIGLSLVILSFIIVQVVYRFLVE
ncbi:MAG TPA: pilin [Candidatus Doudnabacteria bacterium]|nr:pilin [Candidatus Doudnabacteria bacterium]